MPQYQYIQKVSYTVRFPLEVFELPRTTYEYGSIAKGNCRALPLYHDPLVLSLFNTQNERSCVSPCLHINYHDVGCDFRSNGLNHTPKICHETIGDHQLGDDIRIAGLQEPDTSIVASHTKDLLVPECMEKNRQKSIV